ncbi:RNA polymerase sigma factor [Sinomicrobium sp. M5D2P17]
MKSNPSNYEKLIKQLKKGNEQAFSQLVDKYHHSLCIYARSLSHDPYKAEDIVQNVFLKTWEQRKRLKPDFSIKNFLYRSVYNEFIDQYRKYQSVTELEKKYIEALDTLVEEEEENPLAKLIALVSQEIQNLPPKCRKVFVLSKRDGLTNTEIAEYLDISVKAVEAQMTKAFCLIRKKVGNKSNTMLFILYGNPKLISSIASSTYY